MRAFSSDKTKGGANMKGLGRKGKIVTLGLLTVSVVGCAAIGDRILRGVGLYPENSPAIKEDCKPFPENAWSKSALYTALDPEIVLEKPEVKVKRMEVLKGYESFLIEVPYKLKEYIQRYGNTDFIELSSSDGIRIRLAELHLRFLKKGYRAAGHGWVLPDKSLDRWYPYTQFGYMNVDNVQAINFYTHLVVPNRVELTSSMVREDMRGEMKTPYENSLSMVAKNIVVDKARALCVVPKNAKVSEVFGNKVDFIYSKPLRRNYIIASLDAEKGSDRALFMKAFQGTEMLYRLQCLSKEDIEDFLSKNALAKASPYLTVCGDGTKPFFICMEFKDAVCYTAESLNYKALAEYIQGTANREIANRSQANWFRNLLEGKLQERSQ